MVNDLYRQMRPTCSDCGKGGLEWMNPTQLEQRLTPGPGAQSVREAVAFMGAGLDCWLCPACSNWGIFESGSTGNFV